MRKAEKAVCFLLEIVILTAAVPFGSFAEERNVNFVMMGDSIAWGAGILNSSDACYAKMIADTNGYNYTTLASNGYQTKDLLGIFQNENGAETIRQADIIAISVGGNNFLYAGIVGLILDYIKGDFHKFDKVAEDFRADLDLILKNIKDLNPDVTIIVQTLYNPRYDCLRDAFQCGVDRLNQAIRESKEENDFELLDLEPALTKEYIAFDTIHPNKAGNERIAKIYLKKLYELGLGENTEPVILTEGIDQLITDIKYLPYAIRYFFRAVKFFLLILFS